MQTRLCFQQSLKFLRIAKLFVVTFLDTCRSILVKTSMSHTRKFQSCYYETRPWMDGSRCKWTILDLAGPRFASNSKSKRPFCRVWETVLYWRHKEAAKHGASRLRWKVNNKLMVIKLFLGRSLPEALYHPFDTGKIQVLVGEKEGQGMERSYTTNWFKSEKKN